VATRQVTCADLDAYLARLGLTKRQVEINHGRPDDEMLDTDGVPAEQSRSRRVRGFVYDHAETEALIMLPLRPPDEAVAPRHLVPARRALVDRGVTSDEDFDRWLCQMRFPDVCRAAATADGGDKRVRDAGRS
jgi:hypothetical protein